MKAKTILTVVILAFVAVAVAYLVVKEVRKATAPEPTSDGGAASDNDLAETAAAPEVLGAGDRQIVVTYVYFGKRCATCRRLEAYSREAMETGFASEIAAGTVVWRAVNADEPAHKHYLDDYELYAKAVIVSDVRAGEEVRWKNLTRVWELNNDKEAFVEYVQREVRAYREGG
jgi:hypothetical protein